MGDINNTIGMYRAALRRKMAKAHWHQLPVWGEMIGHIGGTENGYPKSVPFGASRARTLRPTGKPIEVLTDFKHQGGWDMDIPIIYPLVQKPVYGDNPKLGKEEKRKWAYNKAYINAVWKPVVTRDGLMGEQALNAQLYMDIMNNAKEELVEFNRKWQSYAPYDALTRGYSENLLAPAADGGFGDVLVQRSHPNFYAAGYGKATWSNTPATYETNVATALDSLTNVDGDKFSTKMVVNAVAFASELRVNATDIAGRSVLGAMIIHPAQAAQLFEDPLFLAASTALVTKDGSNSPLFTGVVGAYLYRGIIFLVDVNAPGVWTSGDASYDSTRGTVNYGNTNPIENPVMQSDRKLAFFVGGSAILCGHTVSLGFEKENWDYKSKESEASFTVVGYSRSDIYDRDGFFGTANLFKENTSSLIIASYSPNSPSW